MKAICMLGLFAVAAIASASSESELTSELKNRPVSKVIELLKDMQKQLEKEQEEDEEVYQKLACWCETNDKAKTKAIEEAEAKITELTSKIEQLASASARLNVEIANLSKEIERNQEALAKATAIRQKQLAEFNEEEKDLLQSIQALKAAIIVLSKHHRAPEETLLHIAAMIRHQMRKHANILGTAVTEKAKKAVAAFVQGDYFGATPSFKQGYAPQSGEIFGILTNMKETFEANLSDAQKQEMENQKAYEDLKAAKEAEIAAGQEQLENKQQELAKTDKDLADSKEELEDTRASLSADQKYLMDLKEKCSMTDNEWAERQKTRQAEIQAVSEALAILSNDDAHDLFTRTFNPSFTQAATTVHGERRRQAATLLLKAGQQLHSAALIKLASTVSLDAFTRVKKAIDDMVAQLLAEKEDEIKHKDWCVDERNQNDRTVETKERDKADHEAKIEALTNKMKELTKLIETLAAEIKDAQVQIKRASEDREAENKAFQATVTDQRETQKLLQQALDVLKGFYMKANKGTGLMQQEPVGPPPPPGFSAYKKQGGSAGVMGLLQQIIGDAKTMEAEAVQAETDAQAAYELFVQDTNKEIETKQRGIVDATELRAKAEAEKTTEEEQLAAVVNELEELANYSAQLHQSCDFIIKNFDLRQAARDQEVEALRQAKAILSGANFGGQSGFLAKGQVVHKH